MPRRARVLRREEGPDEIRGELVADDARAQREHVHVVVLDRLVRRVHVVTDAGADPHELVRGDRGAHAAAADDDRARGAAVEHRTARRRREVGIVHGFRRIGTEVDHLVARGAHGLDDLRLQREPTVIACDGDRHPSTSSATCTT